MEAETATLIPVAQSTAVASLWRPHLLRSAGWLRALALYTLPLLLSRPLFETPEARIAVVAREMIERNNYIEPTLAGKSRLNKPPLPYWLAVATAKCLNGPGTPDERTLRNSVLIPEALSGALAVFIVSLFGSIVLGPASGAFAAMILGFSLMPVQYAQLGYPDTALMLGCAGASCAAAWLACAPQPGLLAALALGVSMAWAILIKEPILLLILPGPVVIEAVIGIFKSKFSVRKVVLFMVALLVAAALVAPWYYLISTTVPDGWNKLVDERTHIWVEGHVHKKWYYYFEELAGGLLPWTPLLLIAWLFRSKGHALAAAPGALPEDRAETASKIFRFMALTALLAFLGFYSQAKEQRYYLLPLIPALALASGYALGCCRSVRGNTEEAIAWLQIVSGLAGAAALCYLPFHETEGVNVIACFGVGFVFLALNVVAARFWAEGKLTHAASAMGLAAFLGLVPVCTILSAKGERHLAIDATPLHPAGWLHKEAPRLRTELDAMNATTVVYAWGNPLPLMNYLLARPVLSEQDLIKDVAGHDAAPPRRVVVATAERIERAGLGQFLPPGPQTSPIIALVLPADEEVGKNIKLPPQSDPQQDED